MRMRKSYLLLLVVGVALSLAIPLLLGGIGQFQLLQRMPWWSALVLLLMVLTSWCFNTKRLCLLARAMGQNVGFWEGATIVISSEFAGKATPWTVGMPVAYTFFLRDLTLSRAAALFTMMIVFDLTFYAIFVPLTAAALMLKGSTHSVVNLAIPVLGVVTAGILFFLLMSRYYRPISRFVGCLMGYIDCLARRRFHMARKLMEFVRTLRIIKQMSWRLRLSLFLTTAGLWLPRYLILPTVIWLIAGKVPLAYLFLIQTALNIGSDMIFVPGGGGGVGPTYAALMSSYLSSEDIAFSLIAWRMYSFYWYLIVGGPIFLIKTGKAAHTILRGEKANRG